MGTDRRSRQPTANSLQVQNFVATCCECDPQFYCSTRTLHDAYVRWFEGEYGKKKRPLTAVALGRALGSLGFTSERTGDERRWGGLRLLEEGGQTVIPMPDVAVLDADLEPLAPAFLSPSTAAFWCRTVEEYELAEHHIRVLTMACQQWDLAQKYHAEIMRVGAVVKVGPRQEPRVHPAKEQFDRSCAAFERLITRLGIDLVEDPAEENRLPRPGGQ